MNPKDYLQSDTQPLYFDLYQRIVEFYPLGVKPTNAWYYGYSGIKKLYTIYNNKYSFSDYVGWKANTNLISDKFNYEHKHVDLQIHFPSYICEFIVSISTVEKFTITKSMVVCISLLGKYYCLYGKEKIFLDKKYKFRPNLIIAPHEGFELPFHNISSIMESQYKDYTLIPYKILNMNITGLYLDYVPSREGNIYNAFFGNDDFKKYNVVGNKNHYTGTRWFR